MNKQSPIIQGGPAPGASTSSAVEFIHGFWKAMVAKTLVELNIPFHLQNGQRSVLELANTTGTRPEGLYRFLRAAAACQLIDEVPTEHEPAQRIFRANEQSQALCPGQLLFSLIGYQLADFEIASWSRLDEALRTGERAMDRVLGMPLWEYLDGHPTENQLFNSAMTVLSSAVHLPLVKAYEDFAQAETVMDVGGGEGDFLITILQAHPNARGILFDRAQVIDKAEERIAYAQLNERCSCHAGSFFEAIPGGANIYTFKNVLHDWDDGQVVHILQNVRRATTPGTKVLIVELLMAETEPSFAVCAQDLSMLLETGGKQRTAQEFGHLLGQAGFHMERVIPVGRTPYSIIEGLAH